METLSNELKEALVKIAELGTSGVKDSLELAKQLIWMLYLEHQFPMGQFFLNHPVQIKDTHPFLDEEYWTDFHDTMVLLDKDQRIEGEYLLVTINACDISVIDGSVLSVSGIIDFEFLLSERCTIEHDEVIILSIEYEEYHQVYSRKVYHSKEWLKIYRLYKYLYNLTEHVDYEECVKKMRELGLYDEEEMVVPYPVLKIVKNVNTLSNLFEKMQEDESSTSISTEYL